MLLAGRLLCSIAWPEGNAGRYYWQHCHWVDSTSFPNNGQMFQNVIVDMGLLYTTQVQFHGLTWYLPGTSTVFYRQNITFPGFGGQPAAPNFNILVSARWRMKGVDGSYTYHLHRQPIGENYLEAGGFSTLGLAQNQIRCNTFVGQGIYRTKTGSLINSGRVATSPVMWQLRHGTKRRERRGWL